MSSRGVVVGYAGLAAFFALEATVRERGTAASLHADEADDGTTAGVVRAFVAGAALPLALRRAPGRRLGPGAVRFGLLLEATGILLRLWSMRTLGAAYTRTLRTGDEQGVVEAGPYRLVRHPGYLGTLLTWLGFALASGRTSVVVAIAALFGRAYGRRIAAEERLLVRDLPGYAGYRRRTKRLVPLVW
jgi:protein-S-isoprenylcysteine O-methyltransferase Ste14